MKDLESIEAAKPDASVGNSKLTPKKSFKSRGELFESVNRLHKGEIAKIPLKLGCATPKFMKHRRQSVKSRNNSIVKLSQTMGNIKKHPLRCNSMMDYNSEIECTRSEFDYDDRELDVEDLQDGIYKQELGNYSQTRFWVLLHF